MHKGLILITKHFPYNKGETPAEMYLENEIRVLCGAFERVLIIAAEAKEGSAVTCSLPLNAASAALRRGSASVAKARCALKAAAPSFSLPDEARREAKKHSLSRRVFLKYFVRRAEKKLEAVRRLTDSGVLVPDDYDAIYSYWFFDNAYLAVRMKQEFGMNAACVSRAHGYDLYEYRNRFDYIPLRTHLFEELDAVYACSRDGGEYLSNRYPSYRDKIRVAYLGCPDNGIEKVSREPGRLRVASCSRVIELKRVDRIASSLMLAADRGLRIEWTHFGDGDKMDALRGVIEKAPGKIEAALEGAVGNTELLRRYKDGYFDVFVNASSTEGLPISVMEAMSFGIPVIATDVGGTSELVRDGENGFFDRQGFYRRDPCRKA